MNHNLTASGTIEINAAPSKVWEALTTPEMIKEYLFGTETVTDWKVGSEIVFQGEYNGHKYRDHGMILENVLNKLLSYSYWTGFSGLEDKPENYSKVTYQLSSANNKTTQFTWTTKGFANQEGQQHSQNGMAAFLEQIKAIIER